MGLREDVREALRLARVGRELASAAFGFYEDVGDDLDSLEHGLEEARRAVRSIRRKAVVAIDQLDDDAREAIGLKPPDPGRRTS